MSGANMPAKNTTGNKFKLGSGKKSQFAEGSAREERTESKSFEKREDGVVQGSKGGKANMPAKNKVLPSSHPKNVLGNTKHGVGQVPGYLQGK